MAIIYTYSKVIPTLQDSVVITDASDNNYTKTALLSDVVSLATNTTYDLTSIQNVNDSDIKLTGSDATVDIVKLVAGTDISIVDSGSNITINSTGSAGTVTSVKLDLAPGATGDTGLRLAAGASDQTINTSGSFDVGGTLFATHGGTGLVTADYTNGDILYYDSTTSTEQLIPLKAASDGDVLTLAGGFPTWAAGAVGVTSVGTSNAMGATSGITFVASTNPIVTTGTIDLSFSGAIGDMWFAETVSSVQLLHIGTSTTTATGSVINQVLAVDPSGVNDVPAWTTKEITIQKAGVDVETATSIINFTGAGVTASSTGAGAVEVDIPGGGGGGVHEGSGTFRPCLVTQGINGTGTLEELVAKSGGTMTYVEQFGRWYIINKQIYFDFIIAFTLGPEPSSTAVIDTLGISAYNPLGATPADKVLGLENINALLASLNLTKNHNAGVDICDVYSFGGPDPAIKGWDHMPQGGKLNKFWGDGTTSNKSVAWLHWLAQPVPGGNMSTQYDVPVADGTWVSMDSTAGDIRTFYIAGSLNPIIYEEL